MSVTGQAHGGYRRQAGFSLSFRNVPVLLWAAGVKSNFLELHLPVRCWQRAELSCFVPGEGNQRTSHIPQSTETPVHAHTCPAVSAWPACVGSLLSSPALWIQPAGS